MSDSYKQHRHKKLTGKKMRQLMFSRLNISMGGLGRYQVCIFVTKTLPKNAPLPNNLHIIFSWMARLFFLYKEKDLKVVILALLASG